MDTTPNATIAMVQPPMIAATMASASVFPASPVSAGAANAVSSAVPATSAPEEARVATSSGTAETGAEGRHARGDSAGAWPEHVSATMVRIAIMVSTRTQGAAYPLAREKRASSTREQWMNTRSREVREAFGSGELPMIVRFDSDAFEASEPQSIFGFGLQRLLDGIGHIIPA